MEKQFLLDQISKVKRKIFLSRIKIIVSNILFFFFAILCGFIFGFYVFWLWGNSPMSDAVIIVSIVIGVITCRAVARSPVVVIYIHAEYIDIMVNSLIFLIVLYRNLVDFSPMLKIAWVPSLEHINSSFLIYIAYTRIEKAYVDIKSRKSKKCLEEFDYSEHNMYYRHLRRYETDNAMACKNCGRLPTMKIYKDFSFNTLYALEHWCPIKNKYISVKALPSRYDALIEWNKLSVCKTINDEARDAQ